MFSAVTGSISISVEPSFLPQESDPEEGRFVWAYKIVIENRGDTAVQLVARNWQITDANGCHREVSGPGVVGQQPVIEPGQSFEYTSGCPLSAPSGVMFGSYKMVNELGETLQVTIPAFSLDMPDSRRVLN